MSDAVVRISELTPGTPPYSPASLLEISVPNAAAPSGYDSRNALLSDIAAAVGEGLTLNNATLTGTTTLVGFPSHSVLFTDDSPAGAITYDSGLLFNPASAKLSVSGIALPGILELSRANGVAGALTPVLSGNNIGLLDWNGYATTNWFTGARIQVGATENWSDTARGTNMLFSITPPGSAVISVVMRLLSTGLSLYGPTAPAATLHLGQSATTARSYNQYTNGSNGEWAYMGDWGSSNIARYGSDMNGTGAARDVSLVRGGTEHLRLASGLSNFTSGRFAVGVPPVGSPRFSVSENSASVPADTVGAFVHFAGADNTSTKVLLDGFGATGSAPVLEIRRALGTGAAPSAMTSGNLGIIQWSGYGTTGYGAARANVQATVAESWTDTAQGANLFAHYTPIGSTTLAIAFRFVNGQCSFMGPTAPFAIFHLGQSATTARSYNQFTNGSNGEWGYMGDWGSSNVLRYGSDMNGTGAARDVSIVRGGVESMRFGVNGVGIGITPAALLHVAGTVSPVIFAERNDNSDTLTANLQIRRTRTDGIPPGVGFGGAITFNLGGFTAGLTGVSGQISSLWDNAQTDDTTSRNSHMRFSTTAANATSEKLRISPTGGVSVGSTIDAGGSGRLMVATSVIYGANLDTVLQRDSGAGALAQRSGLTSQAFRVYNTYTDTSNYERGVLLWANNALTIGSQFAGTGVARDVSFIRGGVEMMRFSAAGIETGGRAWVLRATPVDKTWVNVAYGNGLFVAVANNTGSLNRIMTSVDGVNWIPRNAPADYGWTAVTYGNGLFVAVANLGGTTDKVMTSPDGITWTLRTTPNQGWRSVVWGRGLFVAVATTGTGNRVMTSPDGITWTNRTSAADNSWTGICYGNGLYVAVAINGTGNRVMTSPDGITWTIQTSPADNSWQSVTYGNGVFVAVANTGTGRVMWSPDGVTWTIPSSLTDNQWVGVAYGSGTFVAVAATGSSRVYTSPDGVNWSLRSSADDALAWRTVAYGNGMFAAITNTTGSIQAMTSGAQIEANLGLGG